MAPRWKYGVGTERGEGQWAIQHLQAQLKGTGQNSGALLLSHGANTNHAPRVYSLNVRKLLSWSLFPFSSFFSLYILLSAAKNTAEGWRMTTGSDGHSFCLPLSKSLL